MRAELCLFVLAFGSVAMAQKQPAAFIEPSSVGSAVYITHVTVIDTESGKEAQNRTVVLSGDRISEVKESSGIKIPAGSKIVDGTGKYLIPGLWDMHVHGNNTSWFAAFFPLYLANGVTGIREMFGPPDANKFRADLAASKIDAPHIYLGSPIVDGNPPVWPNSISVQTPEEARRVVDEQKQRGADFVKVYNRLTREEYFAIVDEAKRQNIPVEGHVPRMISAWEAATAKQKSIEHLTGIPFACSSREKELFPQFSLAKSSGEAESLMVEASRSYDEAKCQQLFAELKKNGSWPVPTLTVSRSFAMLNDPQFRNDDRVRYFSGEARSWLVAEDDFRLKGKNDEYFASQREFFAFEKKLVGVLFRAGVPMLAGTDVGNPYCFPGFSLHDELALRVDSGVTPLGALQAATLNPARFMGVTDKYGAVSPGKIADLVLLDADPLVDIHNTTRISEVFLAGKEFDRAALNGMLEKALNSAATARETAEMAALKDLACEAGHAYARRDLATLDRLTADDYVQTDVRGGVLNRAQWLDFVRNRKSELTVYCDSVEVRFYCDVAVVTGGWTYTKLEEGKQTATSRSRWTSVWSKSGSSWKRHAFQNTYVNPNADQSAMTPILH